MFVYLMENLAHLGGRVRMEKSLSFGAVVVVVAGVSVDSSSSCVRCAHASRPDWRLSSLSLMLLLVDELEEARLEDADTLTDTSGFSSDVVRVVNASVVVVVVDVVVVG